MAMEGVGGKLTFKATADLVGLVTEVVNSMGGDGRKDLIQFGSSDRATVSLIRLRS